MNNERVILYPDPDQKVENLWFEIGHFLGFQNVEGYRIIPSDASLFYSLPVGAMHPPPEHPLQGIELDATAAMLLKLRFQTITPEAYCERLKLRWDQYVPWSSLSNVVQAKPGTTTISGSGPGAITTITAPSFGGRLSPLDWFGEYVVTPAIGIIAAIVAWHRRHLSWLKSGRRP
ncbi:hypothetical protein MKK50_15275 [Methylobacterium sp. J-043]|nr:hypothetical protein [Methylobacterium sp. J-043]